MKTRAIVAAAAMLALGGSAFALDDALITGKVKAKLAGASGVSAVGTDVDTKDGVVTLRGEVDSEAEKDLAAEYAKEVDGVVSVDNRLTVKADSQSKTSDAAGAERTADGRERGIGDRAFAKIDDAAITSRVKSALAGNRSTSALNTNVDTRDGRVVLRGVAHSEAEKQLAEKLAKGVSGVKSVDNKIDVSK